MKTIKKILACVLTLVLIFNLTACDLFGGNDNEHHFSDEWTTTETNHYHVCTDEGCKIKDSFGAHTAGDWVIIKEATASEKGLRKKYCTVCNYEMTSEEYSYQNVEHTYGTPTYTWSDDNSSCTANVKCTKNGCNEEIKETVNTTMAITRVATCLVTESDTYTATFTNDKFTIQTKVVDTLSYGSHQYTSVNQKASTFLESGYSSHIKCSVCNKVFDSNHTEIALNSITISPLYKGNQYTQVSELQSTAIQNVSVTGVVIGFVHDGKNTTDHYTREGFILKDIETNDIILVNGLDVAFNTYQDKNSNSIKYGDVLVVKGNFVPNQVSTQSQYQYFECVNVTSSSDIEIKANNFSISDSTLASIQSVSSISSLNTLINPNNNVNNLSYQIFKITGTNNNPISFGLINEGNVSEKNMGLFFGEYDSNATYTIGGKNLVISPYSLSAVTGIEASELYNKFYSFNGDSQETMSSSNVQFTGTLYLAVTEVTQNNIILSVVMPEKRELNDEITTAFAVYKTEMASSTATTYTYTFDGGEGINDIINYIPSLDCQNDWNDDFEIQNGVLTYVGTDYTTNATKVGITCGNRGDYSIDAILNIANSYLYQGKQIQYDMYTGRRNVNIQAEKATKYFTVYLDCSSFVNSVYYNAFGKNLLSGYTTELPKTSNFEAALTNSDYADGLGLLGAYSPSSYTTPSQRTNLVNEIKGYLQKGDILNYIHGSAGHVLIYIGKDSNDNYMFIHCTGSSYAISSSTITKNDVVDPSTIFDKATSDEKSYGAVILINGSEMFTNTSSDRYLFGSEMDSFQVFRPLNNERIVTTESPMDSLTLQAKQKLSIPNVSIEKNSPYGQYHTVYANEEFIITFTLENNNSYPINFVDVKEIVPAGLTIVQVNNDGLQTDNTITWDNLTINGGSTLTLTYKVRINTGLDAGTIIELANGTVNNVSTNTVSFIVGNSTYSNKNSLITSAGQTVLNNAGTYNSGLEMVNAIYQNAYSTNVFDTSSNLETIMEGLFSKTLSSQTDYIKTSSAYYDYTVKNLHGGTIFARYSNTWKYNLDRTRLVTNKALEAGDIILTARITNSSGPEYTYEAYVYINEKLIIGLNSNNQVFKRTTTEGSSNTTSSNKTTTQFLEQLTGYNRWIVLRPGISS